MYLATQYLGSVILHCERRGGGGQTTAAEFATIQNSKNRLCLCITDSDKRYPGADLGDTAKAVQQVRDAGQHLCELLHLEVRAIENLLPLAAYKEVAATDPNWNHGVACLESLGKIRP